jgi:methyl-accepting chemotaxis protein
MAAAAEELSATIQELSGAAAQILAAVGQIGRGSQMQAAATHQTSAALAQIETSARVAHAHAHTADERIGRMETALGESRAAVERLLEGVAGAVAGARGGLATVAALEVAGRRIEKIIDGIALVTVQTTMLAVSGSVEAARAGGAGRGFALVSSDIRALAREASDSVDQAKDTVRGVLEQIAWLRRDEEQILGLGEAEAQNSQAIFASLGTLDGEVAAMKAANRLLVQQAEVVRSGAAQTAAAARRIAAAAEEASTAARQAAAAAGQQARGAEDLAAAIEEIASLADELKLGNG